MSTPCAERRGLIAVTDAAEDHHRAQPDGGRERLDGAGHLEGEFTGGQQDQPAWAAGHPAATGQPGDQRDGERDRLAGAGLAAPQHVPPGQGGGQGCFLDRERRRCTERGQHGQQRGRHAELGEAGRRFPGVARNGLRGNRESGVVRRELVRADGCRLPFGCRRLPLRRRAALLPCRAPVLGAPLASSAAIAAGCLPALYGRGVGSAVSRSAAREDVGRSPGGTDDPPRMPEEKAPTEKAPVVKASLRWAAGRPAAGLSAVDVRRGRGTVCGRAEEAEVLMKVAGHPIGGRGGWP